MELSPVTNLLLSGLTGGEPQRSWELWHLGSRRHCRDWDPCVHSIFSAGDAFSGCSECTRHSRSGNLIFPGLTGVRHLWRLVAQGTRSVALAPPGSRTLLAYAAARQADRPALRLRKKKKKKKKKKKNKKQKYQPINLCRHKCKTLTSKSKSTIPVHRYQSCNASRCNRPCNSRYSSCRTIQTVVFILTRSPSSCTLTISMTRNSIRIPQTRTIPPI